ncbi:MAG TPA: hypothetical protein VJ650_16210 [Gemmatimonadaceae bacterium]|nr:hypothetical protein [Gemmatimonadaceae bacterium]
MRRTLLAATLVLLLTAASCGPKVDPLSGTVAPARLPRTELPEINQRIRFTWNYEDLDLRGRGDGVARVAPPDSVRLDLFLAGGNAGGRAVLIDDELRAPGGPMVRSFLPPPPMLWAALGRLHIPPTADTSVRVDGDTTRADIGRDPRWRVTFVGGDLRRLELIQGDRLQQWMERTPQRTVTYRHLRANRALDLTIVRVDTVAGFDATIWR